MSKNQFILEHSEVIDKFVKQLDNTEIRMMYSSLIDTALFQFNGGWLTSREKIERQMFNTITRFIDNLPLHLKPFYIKFYEDELQKPWRQPYLDTAEVKVFKKTPTIEEIEEMFGTTKWWEYAYEEVGN